MYFLGSLLTFCYVAGPGTFLTVRGIIVNNLLQPRERGGRGGISGLQLTHLLRFLNATYIKWKNREHAKGINTEKAQVEVLVIV